MAPWRRKLGWSLLLLGMTCPVVALAIPFMGLSPTAAAAATGAFLVGGPEILLVLAAAVMGKAGMQEAMGTVMAALKAPAGPFRYSASLVTMGVTSLVPWALYGYLPGRMPPDLSAQTGVFFVCDVLFVAAFALAGPEFWGKLGRLLTWEGSA